jgi:cyclopropane fatty-acyl-phospholipid synthase-like methyltransferase
MSLFSLADKSDFSRWATGELKKLFPFTNNLKKSSDIVYNYLDEFDKFKDSKILIVGAGPSTNEVKWHNLEYDYIFSLNHFYLNSNLKNRKVDIAVIGGEVDYQSDDFLNYVNEFNPILMFELHSRWEKEKTYLRLLYENYPKISCFNTRIYGKLGGVPRLLMFALEMKPKEIYFIGMDGGTSLSAVSKKFTGDLNHSFEEGKENLPHLVNESNAYSVYYGQYEELWNYILNELNYDTRLYNLGENSEYNFSSIWSKEHFPLTEEIQRKISIDEKKLSEFWDKAVPDKFKHFVGSDYAEKIKKQNNEVKKHLLNNINFDDIKIALDWGCGGGVGALSLVDKCGLIVVDLSKNSLQECKNFLQSHGKELIAQYHLVNLDDLYIQQKVDLIFSIAVIQHFPSYQYWRQMVEKWLSLNPKKIAIQTRHGDKNECHEATYFNNVKDYILGLKLTTEEVRESFERFNYRTIYHYLDDDGYSMYEYFVFEKQYE